ncbi:MAG: ATP-dependent Clp protease ATP-binding subunit [Clostridiales bacterium]|nr:ATP-dependent Clp protease ATP-binding subunit [Clostridiales bacterium]MCD7828446.1 ATP-dependent Clp protease ATP-binding subunit [Clostridiales bacterium]
MMCSKCGQRPAVVFISKIQGDDTVQEGLCLKCAMDMNIGPIKQFMDKMGISEDDVDAVSDQLSDAMDALGDIDGFQPGGASTFPFMQGIVNSGEQNDRQPSNKNGFSDAIEKGNNRGNMPDEPRRRRRQPGDKKRPNEKQRKFLGLYCTDLTAKARNGEIDAIIGRDDEIYRVTQILCRRTKNNPCLIGEPGVGKTAIAEGLALKIAAGTVPAKLQNKELHLLDLTALVAGTQFRGQFESRIKGLVDEVKAEGNIILFIDEVHNLVGTGDAEGSMNAANILKPALSRGEIQVIGATTFTEYRKYIEKDSALERRFQPVKVEEPSIEDAYKMLRGIKGYYEMYHRVQISDRLLYLTVTLSERYINDRFLPDKAIDLLDEACTCANLRNKAISDCEIAENNLEELKKREEELMVTEDGQEPDYEELATVRSEILNIESSLPELREKAADNAVVEDDIARVINLWTGIPVRKIIDSDLDKLADMEDHLKARIIGQDEAVEAVCAAIRRNKIQINPQRRPSSFIFVGPTGVGKTELVKQLANELFDTPETLIRLDMSEFMEKHSVSRIIGSPPGYVGYDEAGQLTEKVRRKPYSVILFDEIEKAHPDVMNILLQILDEGKTSDAQGRTVDFSNTVIIMTSNAGSQNREGAMGFAKSKGDVSKERAIKGLHEFLRPEFIGRVDEVIVFNSLTDEDYAKIASLLIDDLVPGLKDKGIALKVADDVPSVIAKEAAGGERGARDIRIAIRKNIEDAIANIIIANRNMSIDEIDVLAENDKIICVKA